MRTMKPKKAKFYELLPRTHRATASQNKRNGANQIEIDGFNYDYLLDRSYWKSYVSAGLKQYYSDLYEEGLMCPVDTRIFHQFENPVWAICRLAREWRVDGAKSWSGDGLDARREDP
ncbi:hypothetical protein Pmar_PMAR021577, partial [Perkinsus marinus ATCC 50983]